MSRASTSNRENQSSHYQRSAGFKTRVLWGYYQDPLLDTLFLLDPNREDVARRYGVAWRRYEYCADKDHAVLLDDAGLATARNQLQPPTSISTSPNSRFPKPLKIGENKNAWLANGDPRLDRVSHRGARRGGSVNATAQASRPALAATRSEPRAVDLAGQQIGAFATPKTLCRQEFVRADILEPDRCTAKGCTVRAASPVLAICRKLVEAGVDPAVLCAPIAATCWRCRSARSARLPG